MEKGFRITPFRLSGAYRPGVLLVGFAANALLFKELLSCKVKKFVSA